MYTLGEHVGEGGQAEVFTLKESSILCAKVFHEDQKRETYNRILYGISSFPQYEYDRFAELLSKLPIELAKHFVTIIGIDDASDNEGKVSECLIMELVFNRRGEIAKTLKQHLLDGEDIEDEFVEIVKDVKEEHKRLKTEIFDFNAHNILVVDPTTPRFIDLAIRKRIFQPWVRIARFHNKRVEKAFNESFDGLPDDIKKRWCTLQESNL